MDLYYKEIRNNNGMRIRFTNVGASIKNIFIPYKTDTIDVVLGLDNHEEYIKNNPNFFGGIIGRVANRIENGKIMVKDQEYVLDKNENENTLHSGENGFQKRLWKVKNSTLNSIQFTLTSPHLDQGFPGELKLTVTYKLTDDNALSIKYHGKSDALTVFNPTNHSYFNLNGHASGDVMQHLLTLDSKVYSVLDEESIPTGHAEVSNTPMDFTTERVIGEQQATGYDDNYILYPANIKQKRATLVGDQTGIQMDVYTDMPCIQLYTGNGLDNVAGKDGVTYQQFAGVCLETQYEPNSVNTNMQTLIDGEKTYETIYQFSGF